MPSSSPNPGNAAQTRAAAQVTSAAQAPVPPPPRLPRRRDPPTRKTALTVDAVVAAAIEVLDETGVAGLSMRRVAAQLGTGAASLYAHVSGKDELLELVFDELVGRVPLPEPDPTIWREQLRQMLRDLYEVLVSHRDAALAGLGRVPTSPKALAGADALGALMLAGGLTDRVTALGIDQLVLFVAASAFEQGLMEQSGMTQEDVESYYAQVHDFYERLPADRYPALAAIAVDMTGPDDVERFEFGAETLIAGLEAMSAAERRRG
jgi:AcrR family transcriptional regulator